MSEEQSQAYGRLIELLLSCPAGQEAEVLQANAELVDAGLVAVMGQYADLMESQGESNAGWLRQFAGQLAQALGLAEGGSLSAGDAAEFLGEILQLMGQMQGDPAQVCEFFRANVARLDEALLRVLPDEFAMLSPSPMIEPSFPELALGFVGNDVCYW